MCSEGSKTHELVQGGSSRVVGRGSEASVHGAGAAAVRGEVWW